jgi:hypothetical protein
MATFNTDTTIAGDLTNSSAILDGQSDTTEWYQLNHCVCPAADGTSDCIGNGRAFLHVRTPWPTEQSAVGWAPYLLEVVGYHTYSGERFHDFKAIVNTAFDSGAGGIGSFYGSYVRVNTGNAASQPYVYRSDNSYGGSRRMCFAIGKVSCCCTGNLWVRIWTNSGFRSNFAWATTTGDNNSTPRF